MSVASSAASVRSVQFMGEAITLDEALDRTIRGIQQRLNDLQVALRGLAMIESGDQNVDEDEETEFKSCVQLEDQTQDLVAGLVELAEELPDIAADIRGVAPKSLKGWHSLHKKERKVELARRREAAKARVAAERLAAQDAKAAADAGAGPAESAAAL